MKTFRISSGQTGKLLGLYVAETKAQAMDSCAKFYGFESYQDGLSRFSPVVENFSVWEVQA